MIINNASGESAASIEALNVEKYRARVGTKHFIVDTRSGKRRPSIGPRPEDNAINPYEILISVDREGKEAVLNKGDKALSYSTASASMSQPQLKSASDIRGGMPIDPFAEGADIKPFSPTSVEPIIQKSVINDAIDMRFTQNVSHLNLDQMLEYKLIGSKINRSESILTAMGQVSTSNKRAYGAAYKAIAVALKRKV